MDGHVTQLKESAIRGPVQIGSPISRRIGLKKPKMKDEGTKGHVSSPIWGGESRVRMVGEVGSR